MKLIDKIGLQARFTIFLTTTSFLLLVVFSALVYTQVKKKSLAFAENSLTVLLEHEWDHLDLPKHHVKTQATLPHFKDVYLRVRKAGVLIYDSFPAGFSDVFPPTGELGKNKLFQAFSKEHNGHRYELQGFYDLTSTLAYLSFLRTIFFIGCLLSVILLIPISLLSTKILLKPFRDLANTTSEVNADKLTFRFEETDTHDEYGILTRNFNKLLDRLEKSFLQTKRFALNASHELRTPLAVIISQGEMAIRKERKPEEYRTALEKIVQPAKRLREIVNRLLFLAELDRLEQEKNIADIDIESAINSLATTIMDAYGDEAKQLKVINANGSTNFIGNREVFDVVVGNLIENAYKFSCGSIEVTFNKNKERLVLKVDDDGPGVSPGQLGTILEPLSQSQEPRSNQIEKRGTGLGLSIVKACLDSIRGTIDLSQSKLGGLSVTVVFPQTQHKLKEFI